MAIYDGPFPLKGKVGNFVFYKVNGKVRVRTVGNMDSERWHEDPAFEKSRNNSAEFGGASAASAALRKAFDPLRKELGLNSQTGHQTRLVYKVMRADEREKGFRPVPFSLRTNFLQNFELNKERPLPQQLLEQSHIEIKQAGNGASLHIKNLDFGQLDAPEGAEQVQLIFHLAVLSDYAYLPEVKKYKPQHPESNTAFHHICSETFDLDQGIESLQLKADLLSPKGKTCRPLTQPLKAGSTLLAAIGIRFFAPNEDGKVVILSGGSSLQIAKVHPFVLDSAQVEAPEKEAESPVAPAEMEAPLTNNEESQPVAELETEETAEIESKEILQESPAPDTPSAEQIPEALNEQALQESELYLQSIKEAASKGEAILPETVIDDLLGEIEQIVPEQYADEEAALPNTEAEVESETAEEELLAEPEAIKESPAQEESSPEISMEESNPPAMEEVAPMLTVEEKEPPIVVEEPKPEPVAENREITVEPVQEEVQSEDSAPEKEEIPVEEDPDAQQLSLF